LSEMLCLNGIALSSSWERPDNAGINSIWTFRLLAGASAWYAVPNARAIGEARMCVICSACFPKSSANLFRPLPEIPPSGPKKWEDFVSQRNQPTWFRELKRNLRERGAWGERWWMEDERLASAHTYREQKRKEIRLIAMKVDMGASVKTQTGRRIRVRVFFVGGERNWMTWDTYWKIKTAGRNRRAAEEARWDFDGTLARSSHGKSILLDRETSSPRGLIREVSRWPTWSTPCKATGTRIKERQTFPKEELNLL